MAKNQNGPKSVGICEKILRAFSHVFPVFRKVRRTSSPKPASPAPNPETIETQNKAFPQHPKSDHIDVPVDFDYTSLNSPHFPIQNTSTKPGIVSMQEKPKLKMQNNGGQGDKAASEDEDQIKQKPILEAVPEKAVVGEGNPRVPDINYRASDYIKRAKMNIIRTGSNVGGGKKATGVDHDDAQDTEKRDHEGAEQDLFSEYINGAKTRIRTTPSMKSGMIVSFNGK